MIDLNDLDSKQKRALRTGPCVSIACPERCEFFVLVGQADGFPFCECGHTQDAHQLVVPEEEDKVDA